MGTMPLTLSVAPEPSLAVRVLLVKRTRSLSRSTAVSTASPLAYSLSANREHLVGDGAVDLVADIAERGGIRADLVGTVELERAHLGR